MLLTDTHALIDFVGTMDAAGLLAGGEYAIISVEEDEIYNPHLEYQYMMKGEFQLRVEIETLLFSKSISYGSESDRNSTKPEFAKDDSDLKESFGA